MKKTALVMMFGMSLCAFSGCTEGAQQSTPTDEATDQANQITSNSAQSKTEFDPQLVEELKGVRAEANSVLLDKSATDEQRVTAMENLGYPSKSVTDNLLSISMDESLSDTLRFAALNKAAFHDQTIKSALEIIENERESDELAANTVRLLSKKLTFRQPANLRQDFQRSMRALLDDNRPNTRLWAYRSLVASHDAVAVSTLVESLDGPINRLPIPLVDALELLHVDGPEKHLGIAANFINDDDAEVRANAARILASAKNVESLLIDRLFSQSFEDNERTAILRSLANTDSEFLSYVVKLLANRHNSSDLRYAALSSGVGHMNYQSPPKNLQISFAEAVERITREQQTFTSDGRNLGLEAKELLEYLKKGFPAVRRHFAARNAQPQ